MHALTWVGLHLSIIAWQATFPGNYSIQWDGSATKLKQMLHMPYDRIKCTRESDHGSLQKKSASGPPRLPASYRERSSEPPPPDSIQIAASCCKAGYRKPSALQLRCSMGWNRGHRLGFREVKLSGRPQRRPHLGGLRREACGREERGGLPPPKRR